MKQPVRPNDLCRIINNADGNNNHFVTALYKYPIEQQPLMLRLARSEWWVCVAPVPFRTYHDKEAPTPAGSRLVISEMCLEPVRPPGEPEADETNVERHEPVTS